MQELKEQHAAGQVRSDLAAALRAAKLSYADRNPLSRVQHEEACRAMPGGNTRTGLFHDPFPLRIARAQDAYIWDADGHQYIDFLGDFSSGLLGHSNPIIIRAIHAALEKGMSLSGHNTLESRLAALITSRFPSIELVRFTNSGTEANLMAVTAARNFTQRAKVLVFSGGYHGGLLNFAAPTALQILPHFIVGTFNDVDGTRQLIETHAKDLAAILVEPIQGAGGCIPGTTLFLEMLRESGTQAGAVLIFDEVMTSRLSVGGRQLELGVSPDMTTLGKYLGGGMSFGAFGGRSPIMDMFDPRRADHLAHSGTFNNNILSMAAGVAGVSEVLSAEALESLNERGERLRRRLNDLCKSSGVPMRFTGAGSLFCMHPTDRDVQSVRDLVGIDPEEREFFFYSLLENDIYIAKRGFFALMLPITEKHCDRLVEVVREFLQRRAAQTA